MALFCFLNSKLYNHFSICVCVCVCVYLYSCMCVHMSAEYVEESQIVQSVNNCIWPLGRKSHLPIPWCELWIWEQQRKNCRNTATNYNEHPPKKWTENRQIKEIYFVRRMTSYKNPDSAKSNYQMFVHKRYKLCFSINIRVLLFPDYGKIGEHLFHPFLSSFSILLLHNILRMQVQITNPQH